MDTLSSIKAFRQVVESGSFVAAAERLEISRAMVTRHVKHVESRLGVRLLNRNSRKLSLTDPGRVYFERCGSILEELQATEQELGSLSRAARGTLRLTSPGFAAGGRTANLLAEYRRRYPDVLIDASFEDRLADLVSEGHDVALRIVSSPDSLPIGLTARPIRRAAFYLAASREYLQQRGTPQSPADLAAHDFVALGSINSLLPASLKGKLGTPPRIALRYRSTGDVVNAITAGIGVGPVPEVIFEDPLFREILVPIFPECPIQEATLYIIFTGRRFMPQTIRTFVDFILESLSFVPDAGIAPFTHQSRGNPVRSAT